jgi:type VI protein secretion system component Hcp
MVGSTAFTFKKSGHAKIFLNLSGTDSKLAQHIPLDSFSFGSEGTIAPGSPGAGAGAGAGKVTIHSFQFVKQVDTSDATLTRDQVTGAVIKEADVFFVSASTKAQAAEYKLADVAITTIQKSGSGQENVSGTFAKIDATLGSGSTKLSTGWMNPGFTVVTNKTP